MPAAKARLCRLGVDAASVTVELFGGNGYCEDWGITRLLRDAQCHPIWEGSENVCVLDVLRAMRRDGAHAAVLARIDDGLAIADADDAPHTESAGQAVREQRDALARRIDDVLGRERDESEARSAALTAALVHTVSAALLLEQSAGDDRKGLVALRYAAAALAPGERVGRPHRRVRRARDARLRGDRRSGRREGRRLKQVRARAAGRRAASAKATMNSATIAGTVSAQRSPCTSARLR